VRIALVKFSAVIAGRVIDADKRQPENEIGDGLRDRRSKAHASE
jgi:hypothetical protein